MILFQTRKICMHGIYPYWASIVHCTIVGWVCPQRETLGRGEKEVLYLEGIIIETISARSHLLPADQLANQKEWLDK